MSPSNKQDALYYIKRLDLQPHPEGGYYKETYRSEGEIQESRLLPEKQHKRAYATAIYFLLEETNFSAFHKIKSDEIWHFYAGDPIDLVEIQATGKLITTSIGINLKNKEVPQYVVKGNTWFAAKVKAGGKFSLVGCTVSPGFDFNDFQLAKRESLIVLFPDHKEVIEALTR